MAWHGRILPNMVLIWPQYPFKGTPTVPSRGEALASAQRPDGLRRAVGRLRAAEGAKGVPGLPPAVARSLLAKLGCGHKRYVCLYVSVLYIYM